MEIGGEKTSWGWEKPGKFQSSWKQEQGGAK